jgi:SAM-dependent methyltransferase
MASAFSAEKSRVQNAKETRAVPKGFSKREVIEEGQRGRERAVVNEKKGTHPFLRFIKRTFPVVALSRWMSKGARALSAATHRLQFLIEWGDDNPEYFDHEIDLYYSWSATRSSFPMEGGVWSSFALKEGGSTLDHCCGDGFYSKMFYLLRSSSVTAIDFDPEAIRWANRNHRAPNVTFILGDIRSDIPDGPFDNIIWDAAVEHFTPEEISALMSRIKSVLEPGWIVSGYTLLDGDDGEKHLHQHEYEFHDKEDLTRFFKLHFANVEVFQTVYPSRTNLYFYATDGPLPLEKSSHLFVRSAKSSKTK